MAALMAAIFFGKDGIRKIFFQIVLIKRAF